MQIKLLLVILSLLQLCSSAAFAQKDRIARLDRILNSVDTLKTYTEEHGILLDEALKIAEDLNDDSSKAKVYSVRGKMLMGFGEIQLAWKELLTARLYCLRSKRFDILGGVIYSQAVVLIQQGMGDSVVSFLDKNQPLIRMVPEGKIKRYLRSLYGTAYHQAGKTEQALKALKENLQYAVSAKDTPLMLSVFLNIGTLQDQTDSALSWFRKGIPMSTNYPEKHAEILMKTGLLFLERDDDLKDSALYYLLEAEKNLENLSVVFRGQIENAIGDYFMSKYEYALALPYFRKAIHYTKGIRGTNTNMFTHNLAVCFYHLGQADSSKHYLDRFRKVIENTDDDYSFMLYHHAMAKQLGTSGDSCSLDVIRNYCKALDFASHIDELLVSRTIFLEVIDCLLENGRQAFLQEYATVVLRHCSYFHGPMKEGSRLYMYATFLFAYAKLEAMYGNTQKALELYDEHAQIQIAMEDEKYNQGQQEALVKYKSELKDQEIIFAQNRISLLKIVTVLLVLIVLSVFIGLWKTSRLNKQITKQNEKIGRQKDELEKLNSVKDRLFSVISHDLRTPVSSLISFSRLLENGNITGEKLNAYLTEMKRTLGYTSTLMSNLLNWARTQMSGYKPVMETLSLADVAIETMELLQPEAARKEITFINTIDHHLKVYADQHMTSLVLRNLMMNAIKYSHKGGTVEVDAKVENEDVRITITDHGTGMDAAMVSEFNSASKNPLQSTPGTLNESGTGLGLMLSKSFVELMGGKMVLKSEAGKGSAFAVYLRKN